MCETQVITVNCTYSLTHTFRKLICKVDNILLLKNCVALEVKVFLVFCFSELKCGVDKFEGLKPSISFTFYSFCGIDSKQKLFGMLDKRG